MVGTYRTHGIGKNSQNCNTFLIKREWKRWLGECGLRCEGKIRKCFKISGVSVCISSIWVEVVTSCGILWTRRWNWETQECDFYWQHERML